MKRILTVAVAAALLAGATAPVAHAQGDEMTMLTQKVEQALSDCDLGDTVVDTLTMAQAAGIMVAASSEDGSEKCVRIEAIARGDAQEG